MSPQERRTLLIVIGAAIYGIAFLIFAAVTAIRSDFTGGIAAVAFGSIWLILLANALRKSLNAGRTKR
jgi:tellurite resistance protein TehA-like permease